MPSYNVPIEVAFEFELECDNCGGSLDCSERKDSYGNTVYKVALCSHCSDRLTDDAYESGETCGYTEGHREGHDSGYKSGHVDGYAEGQQSMEPKDPL